MRSVRAIVAFLGLMLPLMAAGCNTVEERLIQEGIGTELPAVDIIESSQRLNSYLGYLCAQAGGIKSTVEVADGIPGCDLSRYHGAEWTLVVRAGFNDIDRRCDSYLAWLNSRRRDRNAILSEIHDARTFTEALLYTTGAGAAPIAIAGLAFGLASNTFTNYYSRLLFEIEKSTVSVLVHEKRLQYREKLGKNIAFQPDAVHVLREYLLICTPFYIEDLINQRTRDSVAGNDPADKGNAEQIRRSLVAGTLLNAIPKDPRQSLPGAGGNPSTPIEPRMGGKPASDSEGTMSQSTGKSIQRNLCVPETGSFDAATRTAIQQAKIGANQSGPFATQFGNTDGQIVSATEAQFLVGSRPCKFDRKDVDRGYRTAFEKFVFPDEDGIKSFQIQLAKCDPNLKDKASGIFDPLTRAAIKIAKSKIKPDLADAKTDTLDDKSYNAVTRTCRSS
ncbi:hypothetical protein [Bradyrhizobium yuanmingense]|uniref:hypothetical protein n=1 Tax=Bradyrhizobium yuanmingense TaxID=108015 RepID=UPI001CD3E92E|nr:hypothetical protein [Bradyrhizobium yuanmingense]MCA1526536.1 hypothetical protein [Bradyrhizobium yuanmingense]